MYEFEISLRLGNMIFMVFRLNKIFGNGFKVSIKNWKVLGYG